MKKNEKHEPYCSCRQCKPIVTPEVPDTADWPIVTPEMIAKQAAKEEPHPKPLA
jgi:hypothetical protein